MGAKRRASTGGTKKGTKKKSKIDEDDNVAAGDANDVHSDDEASSDNGAHKAEDDDDDEFFETADEKRVRLAKEYLTQLGSTPATGGAAAGDEDGVQEKLANDLEEQERRARKQVLDLELGEGRFSRGHQYAATCVCLSSDETMAFTGSKDCTIVRWDVETGKKDAFPGGRNRFECGGHFQQVLDLCLVEQRKLLISASQDRTLRLWDPRGARRTASTEKLHEHNGAVTAVVADPDGNQLYTASMDKSIKVWDLRNRRVMDTLLGHTSGVTCMDIYSKNRPVTGGSDKVVRFWKVERDTHLMFTKHMYSVDAVAVADSDRFMSGGQDGNINLWSGNSKRPLASASLGSNCWVSALSAIRAGNVVFSGSTDAKLRAWRFSRNGGDAAKMKPGSKASKADELKLMQAVEAREAPGVINGIAVGKKVLACAVGKEHRLGRWYYDKKHKNGLWIVPISYREV